MSNIVPFNPQGQAPTALAQRLAQNAGQPSAFTQGIGAGYANVSIKGKVFQIRYNGQVTHLVDPQTKAPMQFFDVVLVAAKHELSKTYYAGTFQDGSSEAPDCSSEDGVHPTAPAGKQVICHDCRLCPMNAFGSKVSTDGRASNSKACQDTRKVAIVPEWNLRNENFGGSMLLRVPPDSLKALAQYARQVEAQGGAVNAVVTRVMFDYTVAHPKLTFQSVRWLSDQEYNDVLDIEASSGTQDIVSVNTAPQQAALPAPQQAIPGAPPTMVPSQPQQAPVAPVATSAPVQGYAQPAPAAQPQANTLQPPMQPAPSMQPPQTAPGIPANPTSVQASFGQPPAQYAPPQAPVMQQPVAAAQQAQYAAPQAPVMQPQQAYAPQQPIMQAPPGQMPPQQPVMAVQATPQHQGQAPLPQSVLSSVDGLLG